MIAANNCRIAVFGMVLAACGGAAEHGGEDEMAAATGSPSLETVNPGVAAGAGLFTTRGCAGCHRIGGGRAVGPDLAGVVERRDEAWLVAMITRPDSMLASDETARALLAEYHTPMPNMRIPATEAEQLVAYLGSVAEPQ